VAVSGWPLSERLMKLRAMHRRGALDPHERPAAPTPRCLRRRDTFFNGTLEGLACICAQNLRGARGVAIERIVTENGMNCPWFGRHLP
jgi:hypothetical protein